MGNNESIELWMVLYSVWNKNIDVLKTNCVPSRITYECNSA